VRGVGRGGGDADRKVRKAFFFEKKKQKTFVRVARGRHPPRATAKSLFASFSSEKEGLASRR
jgi:hypothetical protein